MQARLNLQEVLAHDRARPLPAKKYLYGIDDRPPLTATCLLGLQHAVLALVFLVYPLAVAQELKLDSTTTLSFLTACVLAIALSTALHFFRPPVGSGSLAVEIPTPIFLPTAMLAGGIGGLPAIAAISLLSGVTEVVFARALRHVRALFPAEVCGIAVMMLGISIIRPGMLNALGVTDHDAPMHTSALIVSSATLAAMAFISIFGNQTVKLLALAGGLAIGMALSTHLGLFASDAWLRIAEAPILAVPHLVVSIPRLDWSIVPLAIVMALVLSVDNIGMLVGIQRQVDPNWHKIDLRQTSGGIQVSGIGDLLAGLFGGIPTGISSANVGLAHATGAVSRIVSLATAAALLTAAFTPKIILALSLVPRPVVGAIMIYAAIYMVVSGMSLILNRILNERRIFVIGFSIVIGLASALLPGVYHEMPTILRPILESPLAVSTLSAMTLTQLFRFGAALKTSFNVVLSESRNESLQELEVNRSLRRVLVSMAADVGADKALIDRSIDVTAELVAAMRMVGCVEGSVQFAARLEDARVEISLRYEGLAVPVTEQLDDTPAQSVLPGSPLGHLLRLTRHVDRLAMSSHGSQQTLLLIYQS
jgi:xanthine/uracil permease